MILRVVERNDRIRIDRGGQDRLIRESRAGDRAQAERRRLVGARVAHGEQPRAGMEDADLPAAHAYDLARTDWQFLGVPGPAVSDSGAAACH